jgi:hypothetical protein
VNFQFGVVTMACPILFEYGSSEKESPGTEPGLKAGTDVTWGLHVTNKSIIARCSFRNNARVKIDCCDISNTGGVAFPRLDGMPIHPKLKRPQMAKRPALLDGLPSQ